MANKFQITITAVDKATARIKQVRQQVAKYTAPVMKLQKSFGAFGRELGLPKVAGAFRKIGTAVGDVYRKVMSLAAPMAAIIGIGSIGGLALLATGWARLGQAVSNSARYIGISVTELTSLRGAAQLAGVSADTLTSSMQQFGDTVEDAAYGRNQQAMAMLHQLGIRLNKTASGAIDSTRAFGDLADAIAAHKNPQAQNFIARQFGLEGLLPMLRKGRVGVEELKRTVRAYGAEMTGPQARAAENFQISLTKTRLGMDGLWNTVLGRVLPVLTPLVEKFSLWTAANRELIATKLEQWAKELAEWVQKIDFASLASSVTTLAKKASSALEAVGGFKGLLIGIAAITLAPIIGGVLSLAAAIVTLGSSLAGLAVGASAAGFSKLALLGRMGVAGAAAYGGLEAAKALGLPETDKAKGEQALRDGDWLGASMYLPAQDFIAAIASRMLGTPAEAGTLPPSMQPQSYAPSGSGSLPRGIRNHNPGNLRPNGDRWLGMSSQQTDSGFVQFDDPQSGLRAMAINLRNQTLKHGLNTLDGIIRKYAPASENDSEAYIKQISDKTGLGADQQLNLSGDPEQLSAVMKAMIQKENGQQPYSDALIRRVADAVTQGMNSANLGVRVELHGAPAGARAVGGLASGGAPRIGATFVLDAIS